MSILIILTFSELGSPSYFLSMYFVSSVILELIELLSHSIGGMEVHFTNSKKFNNKNITQH